MKNVRLVGLVAATVLLSMGLRTQSARAQVPYAKASAYSVDFARAMDECIPANSVTVVNPGAVEACPQTNSATDNGTTGVISAHLTVRRGTNGVSVRLSGSGFNPAGHLSLELTLRTTNTAISSPSPASKTYEDTTTRCFTPPITVQANGRFSVHTTLVSCLTQSSNLPAVLGTGNIEILDAALINTDTNKVVGVPGIRQ